MRKRKKARKYLKDLNEENVSFIVQEVLKNVRIAGKNVRKNVDKANFELLFDPNIIEMGEVDLELMQLFAELEQSFRLGSESIDVGFKALDDFFGAELIEIV